jgi:hypothetical protein
MTTYIVDQSKLSSECWSVQIQGRIACVNCELRDTGECGGRNIRKEGINAKGFTSTEVTNGASYD